MSQTWLVLLPPLIVLIASFATRNLNRSLGIGIISAALIACHGKILTSIALIAQRLYQTVVEIENLYMYGFILLLSILIVILNQTGGAAAFAHAITGRLKSKKSTESASLLLSLSLFIDDYLNGLTIGYVMRPLTDKFAIPRVKLAFLVRALTGPLVILAPLSSWVAVITNTIDQSGVHPNDASNTKIVSDPFFLYLESIPYIFYSFIIILSAWFIVRSRISFGPMHTHERIADTTGNLFGGKEPIESRLGNIHNHTGSMSDLIIPIATLFICAVIGSMWSGGYYLFGGPHGLFESFQHNNNISLVLLVAGFITLAVAFGLALAQNKMKPSQVLPTIYEGSALIMSAIGMVILATILGKLLRIDLMTGEYLAQTLLGALPLPVMPVMFFLVSTLISTVTGSAWGTMMLLIPVALPMLISIAHVSVPALPSAIPLLLPSLGAIFSGAVCGNNISPIADTTVMVATSCGAYPIDHAQTQFLYIMPAILGSCVAYTIIGLFAHNQSRLLFWSALGAGLLTSMSVLYVLNKLYHRSKKSCCE